MITSITSPVEKEYPVNQPQKYKHPKELFHISFYSLWLTFSFYGMRALLIVYMVTQLHLGEHASYAILGTYSSMVFGLPFIGGMISDRFLGTRKSIIWGSSLMIAGHLMLAIPLQHTFFPGLAFVACGCGFGFGTDNTFVGSLYTNKDTRIKDAGYSIYYMIFTIGVALGGLICGYVGQEINWHYGFGLAAIFMVIGLLNFLYGIDASHGIAPDSERLKKVVFLRINTETMIYLLSLIPVALVTLLFYNTRIMDVVMLPLTIASFIYILVISFRFTKSERLKLFAAIVFMFFVSFYVAFGDQQGGSLNLFVIRNVDLRLGGLKLSGLALNNFVPSIWLIALTPVFITIYKRLFRYNLEPRPAIKFAIGFFFMALSFLILWVGCYLNRATGIVPMLFLIVSYFFGECSELNIMPVSYSLISKLSPKAVVSTVMGTLLLAVSLGEYFAAKLGAMTSVPSSITNPVQVLPYYSDIFLEITAGCCVVAISALLLSPLLKKWMQEIR